MAGGDGRALGKSRSASGFDGNLLEPTIRRECATAR
jgi:hypothetical protein